MADRGEPDALEGRYTFEGGTFVPDQGMKDINDRLRTMLLLADSGSRAPDFYVDPAGRYWECTEFEDYTKKLRSVTRRYIEDGFPTVDPDRRLHVDRPGT